MNDPVSVYLDSQDFSRLSSSHRDYEATLPIREELLRLKRLGIAKFVFTDIHVFESMPMHPDQSTAGLDRIRTIVEFCGSNNLPSTTSIIESELRLACGLEAVNDWTEWYSKFSVEGPDKKQIFKEVMNETPANRKQRRAMKRIFAKPLPLEYGDSFANEVISKYPFMQDGRHALQLYASGKTDWDSVVDQLRIGLRDIVSFSEWLVLNWDQGKKFVDTLRGGNAKFQTTLTTLYGRMKELFENNPAALSEESTNTFKRIYKEQRASMLSSFVKRNAENMLNLDEAASASATLTRASTPSTYTALSFLVEVAYQSAIPKNARNPNKHAGSDFTDAMHILFLPHVDIFRADQFSCDILSKIKASNRTQLCRSLNDLPNMIATQYKAKKCNLMAALQIFHPPLSAQRSSLYPSNLSIGKNASAVCDACLRTRDRTRAKEISPKRQK